MIAYVLNLLDLFCTLWALRHGAVELNPLMREVTVMVGYKVIIVGVLLWWLSRQQEMAARYALYVAAVVYGAVDVYHIINIL
nr:MAG TPA: 50S ribosomal protein L2 [Caudoviricetes sp.]